jgi:hypothetical protein
VGISHRAGTAVIAVALTAMLVACGGDGEGPPVVDPTRSLTLSPSPTASLPSPTRSPIRSDSPAESETPSEPSRSPVTSEAATPTSTPAPTDVETTSEASPTSTPTATPTTATETGEGDADQDSAGVPGWAWGLLAALVLALAVGIPLLVRARRRRAWTAELAGAEQEVAWLVRDLLPGLQRSGSREQAVGGWAVSSERVLALDDRLTRLEATAPEESGRERARALRDAVRAARGRMERLLASGTDQSASAEVGSIAEDLSSVLWVAGPEAPRA